MSKKNYLTTSLDEDITDELRKVHQRCLEPLGIQFTAPSVIRHLIRYHQFVTDQQSERVHDAMINLRVQED